MIPRVRSLEKDCRRSPLLDFVFQTTRGGKHKNPDDTFTFNPYDRDQDISNLTTYNSSSILEHRLTRNVS